MSQVVNNYQGQKVGVLGLARTGLSAAAALMRGGASVIGIDDMESARNLGKDLGLDQVIDSSPDQLEDSLKEIAALIVSPGIPRHPPLHPVMAYALSKNIPLLNDIDLLYLANPEARYVGVTGTNGKSTTSALIHHCLVAGGLQATVGGNLGTAVLTLPKLSEDGVHVLELSSYQLAGLNKAHLDVAILLNITPDHLDWHGGFEPYVAAKESIFDWLDDKGLALVGSGQSPCRTIGEVLLNRGAEMSWLGEPSKGLDGAFVETPELITPNLPGAHNRQNIQAAWATARHFGLCEDVIEQAICSFPGLDHRLQNLGTLKQTGFFNDSKATNPESAAKALACFHDIFWIAGGLGKGGDYSVLTPLLDRVQAAFLIGQAADEIRDFLDGQCPWEISGTLEQAVEKAYAQASAFSNRTQKSSTVLLSPAAASFDQYADFEARGNHFASLVSTLRSQEEHHALH